MGNELQIQIIQNLVPVVSAQIELGGGAKVVFGDTMTGTGTPTDPVNVSNDILERINNNTQSSLNNASQIQSLQNSIEDVSNQLATVQDVIPATASSQNQLADQGFVNSSIQTATAYFRGDWATWADVPSDSELYPVDAMGSHTPTTNDYMVVIADEQTNGGTWRYKYTGLWSEQGKSGWQAEYQVNETPFTAAQNAAINSGVTAQAVSDIASNKTSIANLQTSKQNKLTAGTGITIEGNTISASGGAGLPDQTDNAGKFLTTDGTTASWGEALVNKGTGYNASAVMGTASGVYAVSCGKNASASGGWSVAVGYWSMADALAATAVGYGAGARAEYATQLGKGSNADANTFKVANENGNFEMMDANGNVPLDRLTYVTDQIGDISTALTAILGE